MPSLRAFFLSIAMVAASIGSAVAQPEIGLPTVNGTAGTTASLDFYFTAETPDIYSVQYYVPAPADVDIGAMTCDIPDSLFSSCEVAPAPNDDAILLSILNTTGPFTTSTNIATLNIPVPGTATMDIPVPIEERDGGCFDINGDPQTCTVTDGLIEIQGPIPALAIAPDSASFPNTNDTATFTVSNTGGAALTVDSTTLATGTDFSITGGTCDTTVPTSLDPAASCTVIVTYTGTAMVTDTLTAATNTAGADPASASATLNGGTVVTPPALALSPDSATLPPDATFTVSNTGDSALTVDSIALTTGTDFGISGGTCDTTVPTSLDPAGSCTVIVTYTGTAAATDTLTVTTNTADADPASVTATVSGDITGPLLSIDPRSLVLSMTGDSGTVTVTNTGDTEAPLSDPTFDPNNFSVTTTCGTTLAAAASCEYTITYIGTTPVMDTVTIDPQGANLIVSISAGQPPIAIPTLSQWSMMIVGTLLAMLAMVGLRRQS